MASTFVLTSRASTPLRVAIPSSLKIPTNLLPCHNPNVLLMWKASANHRDEALLILNKDASNYQEFSTDHFRHFIQSGAPLRDVSPEFPLEYIHEPFHYALRPGQGIVLVTSRQ